MMNASRKRSHKAPIANGHTAEVKRIKGVNGDANGDSDSKGCTVEMGEVESRLYQPEKFVPQCRSVRLLRRKSGGYWDYCEDGECGPCHWPNADGLNQSPINIDLGTVKRVENFDALKFVNYHKPIQGEIVNNGHSVQVIPQGQELPEVYGGGLDQVYRLAQYHFHWAQHDSEGSEHTLGGLHYPAELHLVHKGAEDPDKIAVFAVFFVLSKQGTAIMPECELFSKILEPSNVEPIHRVNLEDKLPKNRNSFFRYSGSLTTPPCSEVVTWTVFTEPIPITKYQLSCLRNIHDRPGHQLEKNYRPVQKLNDREIFHVTTQ